MNWSTFTEQTNYLLSFEFVQQALIAAALLGILSGVMAPMVVLRQMSFAVHGTSELALMGAAAALLFGFNLGFGAIAGSIAAAIVLALLGMRQTDTAVGVVLSFGMGLSVLFIHLYPGRSSTAFMLLTGRIVGTSGSSVIRLLVTVTIVVICLALFWRPLLFASVDPVLAKASGINVRLAAVGFAILLGLAAAESVQIVGALLVVSLLITPGAAATAVTASPVKAVILSLVFAEISAVGGLVLSLAPGVPVSVLVTALSFSIYLICRMIGWWKGRKVSRDEDYWAQRSTTTTKPHTL